MGNLEKAGIAVVVVLLAIILVVAFVSNPSGGTSLDDAPSNVADTEKPPAPPKPPTNEGNLAGRRRVDENDGGGTVLRPNDFRVVKRTSTLDEAGGDPAAPSERRDGTREVGEGTKLVAKDEPRTEFPKPTPPVEPSAPPTPAAVPGWPKEVKLGTGESLWKLVTREYGVAATPALLDEVMAANGIRDARRLKAGMPIKLPAPKVANPADDSKTRAVGEPEVVKASPPKNDAPAPKRDTAPAPKKDETPVALSSRAPAGDLLPFEPGPLPASPKAGGGTSTGGTYVVKAGETLAQIARKTLGSERYVKDIAELNGIKDPSRVTPGTRLKLPKR